VNLRNGSPLAGPFADEAVKLRRRRRGRRRRREAREKEETSKLKLIGKERGDWGTQA
jgi:hypothetical protein